MKITFEGWDPVDKQPVRGTLQGLDRAQTQAAEQITVQLSNGSAPITIKQNPTALKGSKIRVGAAVWDGAYVLAAYLDAQQQLSASSSSFQGLRCVELGCGCGLLALVLARLGAAAVYATDKPQHLVGPRVNAAKNKLLAAPQASPAQQHLQQPGAAAAAAQHTSGQRAQPDQQHQQQQRSAAVMQVLGLDWEDAASLQQAAASITAQGPIDLIVASDCIYPDPDGSCPSSTGFMAAVTALATPGHTRVLTTFEARSDELRQALLAAAAAAADAPGASCSCKVVRMQPEELPEGFRAPHVELYELQLV